MGIYLHDGDRCSMCERVLLEDEVFCCMPSVRELCAFDQSLGALVTVALCTDCTADVEEH